MTKPVTFTWTEADEGLKAIGGLDGVPTLVGGLAPMVPGGSVPPAILDTIVRLCQSRPTVRARFELKHADGSTESLDLQIDP